MDDEAFGALEMPETRAREAPSRAAACRRGGQRGHDVRHCSQGEWRHPSASPRLRKLRATGAPMPQSSAPATASFVSAGFHTEPAARRAALEPRERAIVRAIADRSPTELEAALVPLSAKTTSSLKKQLRAFIEAFYPLPP